MKRPLKWFFEKGSSWRVLPLIMIASGVEVSAESLWLKRSTNEQGMFADARAGRIGDILTININESISMSTAVDTTTEKSASIVGEVTNLLVEGTVLSGDIEGNKPKTNITGDNDYEAGGTITNSQAVSGTLSVMVIDVLPNGNLVLEGVRKVSYSGETFYILTQGICRSRDITPENSVPSSRVAGARIEIISEGVLTDVQRKGWLSRLNDMLNPF